MFEILSFPPYRQRLGYADADGAVAGGLEDVHGVVQAGALQVRVVHAHQPVPGEQVAVLVGHAPGHQRADDQHRLGGVLGILPLPWEQE